MTNPRKLWYYIGPRIKTSVDPVGDQHWRANVTGITSHETDIEQAVHQSQDNILDTALLLKRVEKIKSQIDRRLKIEFVSIFIAVSALLGYLVLRFW